ncbi:saccharopine dehydrogenase NADP-binding domain-containing protein [Candidatus Acetothermia bacterium]|jgi:saccharopine dehydrogenase-like NADP-dependent oxidoreductase|nr:saccharopine dehydrogenase NADP-binding domain-containing protein [Candidatus Acetothermia bacterium]MCI2432728.1 saccharopine dehydrogenase NADP-binding domain-containing protein [Candidatus Acetothermia bacterium]MCI2435960.1 saccharopine dehydrogenase NADP-binding domain-containing protein [Candidatus Acetothermia bacterium]
MKKVIVLGAGMVGRAIAIDLAQRYDVTAADIDRQALARLPANVITVTIDLSRPDTIRELILDSDLVIGAVPGFLGFQTLKTVIECEKNIVDISFFPEEPFQLDALAQQKGVTAVIDCGVAPGMCNMLLGYHNARMKVESYECLVGGLPVKRSWPYQYKAPFSPIDVIEEYTRPARFVENGRLITREALSDSEYMEFDEIGTLEAFNTDGLRSLLRTMKIPNMREKTLRYPGHIEYIKVLRETGFFSKEPIDMNGTEVSPLDVTTRLLFPKWQLEPDEPEFTVMRVIMQGVEDGQRKEYVYELLDRFDQKTKTSSMARTTGYTCTAVALLVLEGLFTQKGIIPPEYVGAEERCYRAVLDYQKEREIHYRRTERVAE